MDIREWTARITPLDEQSKNKALRRWDKVAKPLYSLGIFEEDIAKIAGILGTEKPDLSKKALVILCSDNGIVEEGVTQTGQEVTGIVAGNFITGDSCVCIMAEKAGVDIYPVDLGIATEVLLPSPELIKNPLLQKRIAAGTKNFLKEPAMTRREAETAIWTGISLAGELKQKGYGLIATGEMGIGNTTTSSAVASVLLNVDAECVTGRGAGLSDSGLGNKIRVIESGVRAWKPDPADPIDVLSKVGGFDLAGLTGIFLGGAIYRIPVVLDGVISAVAALAASRLAPLATDYMLASHVSAEPAGGLILKELGLTPVIHAGMCLGEGTGAVAFLSLLDMAGAIYEKMSTFEEIHIEEYKPLSQVLKP